jgi:hypothetical protein
VLQVTIRATLRVETPLTTISMRLTPNAVFQPPCLHDARARAFPNPVYGAEVGPAYAD